MAQYTLTTFTPGEAETITGLATGMQRDWRKRGFLPANAGHARFDIFSLAELLALKMLADRSVGPAASKDVMPWVTVGIAWHALLWIDAYEGDHERCNEARGLPPKRVDPATIERFGAMAEAVGLTREQMEAHRSGFDGDWLARQVIRLKGYPRIIPAKFFIWWVDGSHSFAESLDAAFSNGVSSDERWSGAVIVLDLGGVASVLQTRAGRPFVHVEFETDDAGELQPPMEYGEPIPFTVTQTAAESSVETTPPLPQKDPCT